MRGRSTLRYLLVASAVVGASAGVLRAEGPVGSGTAVRSVPTRCVDLPSADPTARVPQAMQFAPGIISVPVKSTAPTFAPDGKSLVFERDSGRLRELVEAKLIGGIWKILGPLPLDPAFTALEPAYSADGRYVIFASSRQSAGERKPMDGFWDGAKHVGLGGHLWRIDRLAHGWSKASVLPPVINRGSAIFEPALARSGALYFMRADDGGPFHLFVAKPDGKGEYKEPVPLPISTNDAGDFDPAIDSDERFLIFSSDRDDPNAAPRLFITWRQGSSWSTPVRVPGEFNRGPAVIEAKISSDGRDLYFSQGRAIWTMPLAPLLAATRPAAA